MSPHRGFFTKNDQKEAKLSYNSNFRELPARLGWVYGFLDSLADLEYNECLVAATSQLTNAIYNSKAFLL